MLVRTLALFALAFVVHAQEAPLPAGVERGPSVAGVTEYRFPNGLRAVLFPDNSKPTITVNVVYLVGSRHEGYGETGMAHLLEHMVFKGTVKRPHLVEEFAPRGARRNGTTNSDRTNYFETFPANEDNLRWALDMEADRMVNSTIRREDLDSEMTVVRNEYERGENVPAAVLGKRMLSVAFDWHNYQNATIGNRSDIENVGIDNLRAFYRAYYQPDNAVLVVAGKFEPALALRTIQETFGAIPKPTRSLPKLWTVEPTQDGERTFNVRRQGEVPIVSLGYHAPGARHPDNPALTLAAVILGLTPGGRLHAALVETGKAVNVSGGGDNTSEPGLVRFTATLKADGSLDDAEGTLVKTVEGLAATPPTDAEMKRAKVQLARAREQVFASTEALALALTSGIAQGDWRLFFYTGDALEKVSADQVRDAAAKYFRRDNRTIGRFIPTDTPQRTEITPSPAAELLLKDYQGRKADAAVADFDTSPAHLDAATKRATLPVGLQVALLPKPARAQEVRVRLAMHYGDLESLRGRSATVAMMNVTMNRGTPRMSRQDIVDRLAELHSTLSINATGVSLRTTRDHLADALALMAHVLKEASYPEKEFEQARAQALAGLRAARSDVTAVASQRLVRHMNPYPPGDPRYLPTQDELIEWIGDVRREDVVAVHRDLLGMSHAQLAIVGDFDPDAILPVVERELGGWKSPARYERIPHEWRAIAPIDDTIRIADKASATFVAGMPLHTRDDDPAHPEYTALVVGNYVLGASGFSSRLFTRIRGKEGLSYGVNSSVSSNSIDEVSSFSAVATAAPGNIAQVEKAFREELQRLYAEGITDQELADAKRGLLQLRAQTRTQDETLANGWVDKLYRGRTWAESERVDHAIESLTKDDVAKAIRMHLDPARLSTVKAGTLP